LPLTWLFALACFALAGCGGPPRAEVEGVVTLDGRPLPNVEVIFLPDPELGSTGPRAAALTDAQGHYRLHSDRGQDGAVVGKYRVLIVDNAARQRAPRPPQASGAEPPPSAFTLPPQGGKKASRVPVRYGSATATPLRSIEVKRGPQRHDFKVEGDPNRS
jgi:hypothetical protein